LPSLTLGRLNDATIPSPRVDVGLTNVNYKRDLSIEEQDRDGTTLRRWPPSRARRVRFVACEWDNEADKNVIESVTLTFGFFEIVQ